MTSPTETALIELGLGAVNSQSFRMGLENLETWHLLSEGTAAAINHAVETIYRTLWQDGGCITQCEFGPGAKPENVYRVYQAWDKTRNL